MLISFVYGSPSDSLPTKVKYISEDLKMMIQLFSSLSEKAIGKQKIQIDIHLENLKAANKIISEQIALLKEANRKGELDQANIIAANIESMESIIKNEVKKIREVEASDIEISDLEMPEQDGYILVNKSRKII